MYRFDGWVVCEENVDVLVAAWEEEQAILKQKEHEVIGFLEGSRMQQVTTYLKIT
jgi:hypothetical protein